MSDVSPLESKSCAHCILPAWSAPPHVSALTTTRQGGVSTGPYASMNLALHVGDDPVAVNENRRRLRLSLPVHTEPYWLNQTHGNRVVSVETDSEVRDADGAYTTVPGQVLSVLTADCLPVVLTNGIGTEIAVVHAGWRGLASGILSNAAACFSDTRDMHAWMGPAIGADSFEVGDDVKQAFCENMASHAQFFKPHGVPGKYLCDLYGLARAQLHESDCVQVSGGEYCTFAQAGSFHSHRRDGVPSGRMATVAWINSV